MAAQSEIAHLRHRREELTRRYEQAVERVGLFPNPVNERQRDQLAEQIRELDARLEELGVTSH
jgi:chromosome segregation ATPase